MWAKCNFCLVTWYTFSLLSVIVIHFFLHEKSSITCVYLIFCFVFNSSENKFDSCANICISKVIDPCNLQLYEVVLVFCCLIVFYFKSKNGLILGISEGHLMKNTVWWKVKLFGISVLSSSNVINLRFWIESSLKNKSRNCF